jgi:hypothetical protein
MTIEELAALLTALTEKVDGISSQGEALKAELFSEVDRRNKGAVSSLTKQFTQFKESLKPAEEEETETSDTPTGTTSTAPTQPDSATRIAMKQMQEQMAALQQQLEAEKQSALMGNRKAALTSVIGSKGVIAPGILYDALNQRFGNGLKEENGAWFVQSGDEVETLEGVIDKFLGTDEGKAFLPASGVNGSGSSETKSNPQSITPEMTAGAAFMAI